MIDPLARQGLPVCAHAGHVPQKTRMMGLRAMGKTAEKVKA
jgi:ketopantoate hydroxymethyltransferase